MEGFVRAWVKNWKFFALAAFAGVVLFLSIYISANQIEVETSLMANSRLGESISQKTWESDEKGNVDIRTKRDLKDLVLWLKTYDFMDQFLKTSCAGEQKASFCDQFSGETAALKLIRSVDTRIDDDKVLALKVRAKNAQTATDLANALAKALITLHEDQAKLDVKKFEQTIMAKRAEIEDRLHSSLKQLSTGAGGTMPTLQTSPDKQYAYLSELQTKAADIDLKISENERAIKVLKDQIRKNQGDDYGPSLDIHRLRTENKLLAGNKKSIESQVRQAVKKQYGEKGDDSSLTRLQEQFRIDLETYTSLTRASEKIKLIASVPNMNLEIFQKASPILARSRWPLSLMIGLGLFLSQLAASVAFLLFRMWKEDTDRIVREEIDRELTAKGEKLVTTNAVSRHHAHNHVFVNNRSSRDNRDSFL